jgi:hypothetical protein
MVPAPHRPSVAFGPPILLSEFGNRRALSTGAKPALLFGKWG